MSKDLEQLRAENARLRELLSIAVEMTGEPECWYDHHGYCQAHNLEPKGECWVELSSAALSADLAPVEAAWQPIETAPRDGTRFLAFERGNADYQIYECWWGEDFGNWEGWRDAWDSEPEPSHWMPLPPPPAGENGND